MTYTQRKSLRQRFWRLNLTEMDLQRIATSIQHKCPDGTVTLEIRSSDEQDLFRSNDLDFFTSAAMPQNLSRVQISARNDSMTCALDLRAGSDRVAELTASGEDVTTVSGAFHELVRELEAKQMPGSCIARWIDNALVYMAFTMIAALSVYSLFDFVLDLALDHISGFRASASHTTIVSIGWICVGIALVGGGVLLHDRTKVLFPAVQFSGRLSDPSSGQRRVVALTFTVILVPIILNVLANFLTDLLKLATAG